jgi:hypothetical protein
VSGAAGAYPIPPATLETLSQEADLIVVAEVERVSQTPAPAEDPISIPSSLAHLRVLETWKGQAPPGLKVAFHEGLICPAPPRYAVGERVLAFLKEEKGAWTTVSMSYGTRYPGSDDDLRAYREVLRARPDTKDPEARRDWLVQMAQHPATRWDGLYALGPSTDTRRSGYDPKARPTAALTPAQREQLARAYVASPQLDGTTPMLLALLSSHPDAEVDRATASVLEHLLATPGRAPWWTAQVLQQLEARLGTARPAGKVKAGTLEDRVSQEARNASGEPDVSGGELKRRWEQLKTRAGLKPGPLPPQWSKPKVRGTGGDTPL